MEPPRERTLLFVCSGNTCRSPMAQAIAAYLVARKYPNTSVRARVLSAGTSATPGSPATIEAHEALKRLGIPLHDHSAQPVTRELLDSADPIFVLTRRHIDDVLHIDPTAADRVELLDPSGQDVEDPIGGPQSLYDEVARQLYSAIEQRLGEMDW